MALIRKKPKPLTTKDTKEHRESKHRKARRYRGSNAEDADQEKSKLKPTTEARRREEEPSWRDKS
jgi:hypothetical protein